MSDRITANGRRRVYSAAALVGAAGPAREKNPPTRGSFRAAPADVSLASRRQKNPPTPPLKLALRRSHAAC